jgi:hypothetical protein
VATATTVTAVIRFCRHDDRALCGERAKVEDLREDKRDQSGAAAVPPRVAAILALSAGLPAPVRRLDEWPP